MAFSSRIAEKAMTSIDVLKITKCLQDSHNSKVIKYGHPLTERKIHLEMKYFNAILKIFGCYFKPHFQISMFVSCDMSVDEFSSSLDFFKCFTLLLQT